MHSQIFQRELIIHRFFSTVLTAQQSENIRSALVNLMQVGEQIDEISQ